VKLLVALPYLDCMVFGAFPQQRERLMGSRSERVGLQVRRILDVIVAVEEVASAQQPKLGLPDQLHREMASRYSPTHSPVTGRVEPVLGCWVGYHRFREKSGEH
jgi:hypothetical protein